MLAFKRPLTLQVRHERIPLEKACLICGGSGILDDCPCDVCAGGYLPTYEGMTILQFLTVHFRAIMPNIDVLNEFTDRFRVK